MAIRVLILRSNPVAPDPRVEKIARSLSGAGYSVRVLGWDRSGMLPPQESSNGVEIHRLTIRAAYGSGLANLPHLLRWQAGLFRWLRVHRREFDILHACDFDTVLPALLCKALWRKRVVYDIFDFYADHLRKTPAILKTLIRRADLWAINRADALILVDDARRTQIRGAHPRRLAIIYNSPEELPTQDLSPVVTKQSPEPESLSAGNPPLQLAYVGLLQVERGLLEMLAVLRRHPEWRLDLAGFGGDEAQIAQSAAGLPNVIWHGRVPYDQAIALSRGADVLFATYDPAIPNHRYSSPNKVFEAMMLGKPVIVARDTNMDAMIAAADCGIIVPYGDVAALESALTHLADPALRQRLGENARRAYTQKYSWAEMQRRLVSLYRSLA